MIISPEVMHESVQHVQSIAHEEQVGVVIDGKYFELQNISDRPAESFKIDPKELGRLCKKHGVVEALIHSHVDGQAYPSVKDMQTQMKMNVPWVVHVLKNGRYRETFHWGDHLLDFQLIGRHWRAGVFDCTSAMRSWYWQNKGVYVPDLPRTEGWWDDVDSLEELGKEFHRYDMFEEIEPRDIRRGDTVFMSIRNKEQPNHFAVMETEQVMYHHTANALSARRPCTTLQGTIKKAFRLKEK